MKNLMITKRMLFVVMLASVSLASCTSYERTMREPMTRVELNKADFQLSGQVEAEASSTKILCIDWSRLFMRKFGTVDRDGSAAITTSSVPVIGTVLSKFSDWTANYALYNLMDENPGYDVVFYPQYEIKRNAPIGIPFLYSTTTVKVKARLAKFN